MIHQQMHYFRTVRFTCQMQGGQAIFTCKTTLLHENTQHTRRYTWKTFVMRSGRGIVSRLRNLLQTSALQVFCRSGPLPAVSRLTPCCMAVKTPWVFPLRTASNNCLISSLVSSQDDTTLLSSASSEAELDLDNIVGPVSPVGAASW